MKHLFVNLNNLKKMQLQGLKSIVKNKILLQEKRGEGENHVNISIPQKSIFLV